MPKDALQFRSSLIHPSVAFGGGSAVAILHLRSLQTTTITATYLYMGNRGGFRPDLPKQHKTKAWDKQQHTKKRWIFQYFREQLVTGSVSTHFTIRNGFSVISPVQRPAPVLQGHWPLSRTIHKGDAGWSILSRNKYLPRHGFEPLTSC